MRIATLSTEALQASLNVIPQWEITDGKLARDWTFSTFADAILFVNQAALLAEELDHHPDVIDIRFNKVRLELVSHDAGALTTRDLRYAARLDERTTISGPVLVKS